MKVTENLRGLLLPAPTPFGRSGEIDFPALKANIDKWSSAGVSGFVLLGSTGERVHLDDREYLQTIETARAAVPTDQAFIAGAGQQSVIGTISEVKRAARAGAEAVLVITPYFYRSAITQETLVSFYTAVADEAPVPVLLYSMPPLTGIKIEPDTVARLSEHANIIGAKVTLAPVMTKHRPKKAAIPLRPTRPLSTTARAMSTKGVTKANAIA